MSVVTRFAPSPNGPLHLGHAYSAIVAHDLAAAQGGRFLLRIEDIDGPRSRPELADAFRTDLAWLGLAWTEVPAQSCRLASYAAAAATLKELGLLYPCTCTRVDVERAGAVPGPMGLVYPGTCRNRRPAPAEGADVAWRIDVAKALARTGPLHWTDAHAGLQEASPHLLGDVVLVRKEAPASYHLAVVVDDAADGVTLVTRGRDLFAATHLHRLLQSLLDLPVPRWHHHPLLVDDTGAKLAKRRGSPALAARRRSGEDGRTLAARLRRGQFPAGITLDHP
ncbi:tRNA glutamyl-Q(34) synthetase GluQRS [Erythrobacteraceae bacterium CFH 75059]|uniref:tRNA glutamyl-Q(34) synthetase GluQRS n=1 Tax=Qipengyuania thermophila TaxID=2509361 RepID=UPI001022753E|nr:tRNA glutamyl-Q(34) synthetase GluQRS [Qipengyuania thermophila]TCD06769.1 tRNA glutamyl-Q(34) synthetase GluQRS [Erythrobacteraceae bacterium CFH 75059]